MSLVKVVSNMTLELREQERRALLTATLVANRVFDLNLVEDGTVVQLDEKSVADGAFLRVVVVHTETFVLDAVRLCAEGINTRISGGFVGTEVDVSVLLFVRLRIKGGLTSFQRSSCRG